MLGPVRLLRIANRLGLVVDGSPEAGRAIHEALGRIGRPPPYTRDVKPAPTLMPSGFEVRPFERRRPDLCHIRRMGLSKGMPHPHVGQQWGSTPALALSGAVLRAQAGITGAGGR
jgi:hypothetical protein